MLRFLSIAMACIALFIPLPVFAGPPIITDDTGTPGPGRWEMNMGLNVEKRSSQTAYQAPTLDLNYGVGEHIQLNYSVPWIVLHVGGNTIAGLGDSEVAVKWRFLDQDRQGVDMSVYPRFIFNNPTSSADRGIVDKGTVFRLPFQMEKKVGILTVNPEVGHDFHQEGGDAWIYSLALKYTEVKGVELLAEIFGTVDNKFSNGQNAANIGVRKDVNENSSVHASVGTGVGSRFDRTQLLSYVGIQVRF